MNERDGRRHGGEDQARAADLRVDIQVLAQARQRQRGCDGARTERAEQQPVARRPQVQVITYQHKQQRPHK